MHITTTTVSVPNYNTNTNWRIVVTFPNTPATVANIDSTCVLDCRLNGYLSAQCTSAGTLVITMYLPKTEGLT